jgi:hypothetical protein
MSTKKQSQTTKSLIRLTESINQRSAYENKTHNGTTQKTKKMSNTDLTKKPRVNSGACEG